MAHVGTVVAASWLAFWIYWLASAAGTKSGRTQWSPFAAVRIALVLGLLVVLRSGIVKSHPTRGPWVVGVGLALFYVGLVIAVWARVHIGRNWGTPMSEKDDPDLVTSGPYGRVRHPIYSGIILAMVGTALAVNLVWLALAAAVAGYFVYSATREERYMTERFPLEYPAYRRRTKMLIPFLF